MVSAGFLITVPLSPEDEAALPLASPSVLM